MHKHNSINLDKGIGKYNLGTIIKESLDIYFGRAYALCKKYYDISNELIDSWNKNYENFCPYAGAKTIDNNSLLMTFFMNHFIHLKTR